MIEKLPKLSTYYQPIPFEEYNPQTATRMDCSRRYIAIKESYGSFTGKTLLDFGCAEGYFMWRFVQDSGKYAVGVETSPILVSFINQLATAKDLPVYCTDELPLGKHYDICFYLDLYGHTDKLPPLKTIHEISETLYVSPSGNADERGMKLREELESLYSDVVPIGAFYENRMTYRCSK